MRIRANNDVTATAGAGAFGISLSRGLSSPAGLGGIDLITTGMVRATSSNGTAIGVMGLIQNTAANAATLSIRTEGDVIAVEVR
jgi:hypothetical protein